MSDMRLLLSVGGVYLAIAAATFVGVTGYERKGLGTSWPKAIGIGLAFGAFWPVLVVAAAR